MIRIGKNLAWRNFEKLFDNSITERFDWFMFEFGKRLTFLVHKELLGRLSKIKGTRDYQKRLLVAEIRNKGGRAWWAIAARATTIGQTENYDPNTSILQVVPRYDIGKDDPIGEILINFGPWTAETIPFVPSQRQASVVMKKATTQTVTEIKRDNLANMAAIQGLMTKHELVFDTRNDVYRELKIVPDLEVEALRIEFGQAENSGAHWRPAIRFAKTKAIDKLMNDKDLIAVMTDPKFKNYKNKEHLTDFLNPSEVKALENFQRQLRGAAK